MEAGKPQFPHRGWITIGSETGKCFIYKDGFLWLSRPLLCFLLQVRALRRAQIPVCSPTSATGSKSKAVTLKVYSLGDILEGVQTTEKMRVITRKGTRTATLETHTTKGLKHKSSLKSQEGREMHWLD